MSKLFRRVPLRGLSSADVLTFVLTSVLGSIGSDGFLSKLALYAFSYIVDISSFTWMLKLPFGLSRQMFFFWALGRAKSSEYVDYRLLMMFISCFDQIVLRSTTDKFYINTTNMLVLLLGFQPAGVGGIDWESPKPASFWDDGFQACQTIAAIGFLSGLAAFDGVLRSVLKHSLGCLLAYNLVYIAVAFSGSAVLGLQAKPVPSWLQLLPYSTTRWYLLVRRVLQFELANAEGDWVHASTTQNHKVTVESLPRYPYEHPLPASSIRLLTVGRRMNGKVPICHLETYLLRDAPRYFVASFQVDPNETRQVVEVDGKSLMIPDSALKVILRQQQTSLSALTIWIECICVDSYSEADRRHHEGLARGILEGAERLDFYTSIELRGNYLQSLLEVLELKAKYPNTIMLGSPWLNPYWDELALLLSSSRLKRLESIQEVAFAREVRLIHCYTKVAWDHLASLLDAFDQDDMRNTDVNSSIILLIKTCLYNFKSINTVRERFRSQGWVDIGEILKASESFDFPRWDSHTQMAARFADDGGDRIRNKFHLSDMSTSAAPVLVALNKHLVSDLQDMSVLGLSSKHDSAQVDESVPTWAWTCRNSQQSFWPRYSPAYNASITHAQRPEYLNEAGFELMRVRHIGIGTIGQVNQPIHYQDSDDQGQQATAPADMGKRIIEFTASAWDLASTHATRYQVEELQEAVWRTMLADRFIDVGIERCRRIGFLGKYRLSLLHHLFMGQTGPVNSGIGQSRLTTTGFPKGTVLAITLSVGPTLLDKRFAVTNGGDLALVHRTASVGDELVLIEGAETPFVVRRHAMTVGHLEERPYELIGACYVHGAMDGQLDDGSWKPMVLV